MKQISCEESEKYDRSKLTVGASYTLPLGSLDAMTEWGTRGKVYIPILRDIVECESVETMKVVKCWHYLMEPDDADSDWMDEELQAAIDGSVSDELRDYQKIVSELKKWRHEVAITRAKRPEAQTVSQHAQAARDRADIDRITKILNLRG